MLLRALRDGLNRCIFRMNYESALSDPWWNSERELDVKRVCDFVQTSVFIAMLWSGNAESAMFEHIDRLNFIKIKLDQYIDIMGGSEKGKVSNSAVKTWLDAQHAKGLDVGDQFRTMGYLWQILCLSNPQKLEYALEHCGESLRVDLCRLYSDDLDTAVGLLSMQINLVHAKALSLLA
jgi:hypothetical protein